MEGKGGNMVLKIMKDMLLVTILFIAMSKIGEAQEPIDQGGVKLRNGCYTMIVLLKQQDGSILIRTMQDCRGGRPI
jgi:hypothetical protein